MPAKPLTDEQKRDAARLKAIFEQRKRDDPSLTQEKLAFLCEWKTQGAVNQYLLGKIPLNMAALVKFSRVLEVSPGEISPTLAGEMEKMAAAVVTDRKKENATSPEERVTASIERRKNIARRASDHFPGATTVVAIGDDEENADVARIRKVKLKLSAGIAGFAVEPEIEDGNPIFFRKSWLIQRGYKPEHLIAIRVKGQSMEPGLYADDTVVINTADTIPRDGDVFAVNYEGEDVVKRLIRDSGKWWLSSDNPDQRRFPRKECEGDMCLIIGKVIHKQSERI